MSNKRTLALLRLSHTANSPSFSDQILFKPILDMLVNTLSCNGIKDLLLVAREKTDLSFDFGLHFDSFIRTSDKMAADAIKGFTADPKSEIGRILIITAPVAINETALCEFLSAVTFNNELCLSAGGDAAGCYLLSGDAAKNTGLIHSLLSGGSEKALSEYDAWEHGGICYPLSSYEELSRAEELFRDEVNSIHMSGGVRFIGSSQSYISQDVKIGRGTTILPGCIIKAGCEIGENCVIGPNTILSNSSVGDGTEVNSSQIISSKIGRNAKIGPFAYIRPDCVVDDNVRIGDFVELKNAKIGRESKVSHLTYVGDAVVGKRVNFGCGTVTVNYDGVDKNITVIEDDSFIGCNTNLIAPVKVGKGAYTAAGTTVTSDVPDGALSIGRVRQSIKPDWVKDYKLKAAKKEDKR
jgi:bifunctional UDP-N-acetylglucosamine pyrophosphorylase/glucosamine-1-phosphate N-acetyltransferase